MTTTEFLGTLYFENIDGEMGLVAIKCGKKHYGLIYPKEIRYWIDDFASRASCYPADQIARMIGYKIANATRFDYSEHYCETLEDYAFDAIVEKAIEWINENESEYMAERINDRDTGKLFYDYEAKEPVFVGQKREKTEKKIEYSDDVIVRLFKSGTLSLAFKKSPEHIWHVANVDSKVFDWTPKRILKVFKDDLKEMFELMQNAKN